MALPIPLINRERAAAVMHATGVSALVLADPTNVYQATGFWPQVVAMGHAGSALAVVPADPAAPVVLVIRQFSHYFYDIEAMPAGGPLAVLVYTGPHPELAGEAAGPTLFTPAPGGSPDQFEQGARASMIQVMDSQPAYATASAAMRDALPGAATGSTLAVDGHLAASFLNDDFVIVPADPLVRRIRMIKSAAEIALMRHAAHNNAEATRVAVASVERGSSYLSLRNAFFAETGRRGGVPMFLLTDSPAASDRDGIIREGRAFQLDAVSSYAGYHGDFGRTVVVGDAQPLVWRAIEAAVSANDAVAAVMRPGMRYSDIMRIGQAAIADAGFARVIPAAPHSVGLFHTDEAFTDGSLSFDKADHLIEKDMVLSIDCPVLYTDMGGTVHLEDLWLITEDGCEPLNDRQEPFFRM